MITYRIAPMAEISGTYLLGYLHDADRRPHVTYRTLVELFGPPCYTNGDKTQAEWVLRFPDGAVATVYDYKEAGPVEDVTCWHVGGRTENNVLPLVQQIVRERIAPEGA